MPTTLLHGETWDQAYARRFREEAEHMTRCPHCNKPAEMSHVDECAAHPEAYIPICTDCSWQGDPQ